MNRFRSNESTIVAVATPPGEGGLGVVRLSGPHAIQIVDHFFSAKNKKLSNQMSHSAHHGQIKNGTNLVDDVVVTLFKAPHSYTGEDVVEISSHGSPFILKEIVHLTQTKGAQLAGPGEFTQRAYLNGKMDLAQAEAVADLISSRASKFKNAATQQLDGVFSKRINAIKNPLVDLIAHTEANLDFVEEDIPDLEKNKLVGQIKEATAQIDQLIRTGKQGQLFRNGLKIVIVGSPNAGKSSLFNALLLFDRAIVTDVPGTTRDLLEEELEWEGLRIVLTDTAGLRSTQDPVEKEGTKRTQSAFESADLLFWVVDGTTPFSKEDEAVLKSIAEKKIVVVLNKVDQAQIIKPDTITQKTKPIALIETSTLKSIGLRALKEAVLSYIHTTVPETDGSPVVTRARHLAHLEKASKNLKRAQAALEKGHTEEAVSVDLKAALNEISAITGENVSDDVLASIFKQFCIGK